MIVNSASKLLRGEKVEDLSISLSKRRALIESKNVSNNDIYTNYMCVKALLNEMTRIYRQKLLSFK